VRRQADAEADALLEELAATAESQETKDMRTKEAMVRRLLKGSKERLTLIVLGAWRSWAQMEVKRRGDERLKGRIAQANERAEALRLEESLVADAQKQRLAQKVAKSLLRGGQARIFHAWFEYAEHSRACRERDEIMAAKAAAQACQDRQICLLLERQSQAKHELVRRAFAASQRNLLLSVMLAWHHAASQSHAHSSHSGETGGLTRALRVAEERADRLSEELHAARRHNGETEAEMRQRIDKLSAAAEVVKAKLAAKLSNEHGMKRQMMIILHAWHHEATVGAAERRRFDEAASIARTRDEIERKREAEKERLATAHAARFLMGARGRCFVAWRSYYRGASLNRAAAAAAAREELLHRQHGAERELEERRTSQQMANVLARMQRDRLLRFCASVLGAWRRIVADSAFATRDAQAISSKADAKKSQKEYSALLQEKESLTGQLRLSNAAREAEARRTEMVRSEARLEAQARITQLETSLRRAELDAQDAVRQAELKAEERRNTETRSLQLQLTEVQNTLRLERLERTKHDEVIRAELREAHGAEAAEIDLLRRDAAEVSRLRVELEEARRAKLEAEEKLERSQVHGGEWLAGQSSQLKQITQLQLQLAELQRELRFRDDKGSSGVWSSWSGGSGDGGRVASSSVPGNESAGAGFFAGLFGGTGDPPSPDGLSRASAGSSRAEVLAEELESQKAQAAAMNVQINNMRALLAQKEQQLAQLRPST
jgi:hypothetical protein